MLSIACPGCQKQYKLPPTAAGQVASCKCGTKFRVAGGNSTKAEPAPVSASAKAASTPRPAAPKPAASDAFWDQALKEPAPSSKPAPAAPTTSPVSAGTRSAFGSRGAVSAPTSKKESPKAAKPKKKKVAWGFQWGQVGAGLVTFLVFGGITWAAWAEAGVIPVKLAVLAGVGLITCLSGLMGEEGIW